MLQPTSARAVHVYNPHLNSANAPKRKIALKLKDIGYTLEEIKTTISVMLAMHLSELYGVYNSPDVTVLERMLAGAVIQSIGDGKVDVLETLIERAYGKTRPAVETIKKKKLNTIDATKVDAITASNIYREMMTT